MAIGIDSVNRLTPSSELEELLKGEVEARKYPLRALLTSSWLDSLIPTLERDEIVVFVQRESTRMNAMPGQRQYRVKGGVAPIYDGGWICRVTSIGKVRAEAGGKDAPKVLVGEKHEIEVLKNSMGPHLDEVGIFYSSVGAKDGAPLGFDFPREVREESLARGLIRYVKGKGYLKGEETLAANKTGYLAWLQQNEGDTPNWKRIADELDAHPDG